MTTSLARPATGTAKKPGLIAEMLRLWLEHNQRMLDMRMGPF